MPARSATRQMIETTNIDTGTVTLAGVIATEKGNGRDHQTVLTLTNASVTITDAGTSGAWGSAVAYLFPRALIGSISAVCNLTVSVGTGMAATSASFVSSVGTAAASAATLASTMVDVVPSTSAALTSSAGTMKGITTTVKALLDGSTTSGSATSLKLNFASDATDSTATSTATVSGTITLNWKNLGNV